MKNNFQSKAVPRGTRTIWRYLGALFILFTFAVGNVMAQLSPALPATTLTLPTIPSEGWKGTVTPAYYKAEGSNVYVFSPYELYLSVANLTWTTQNSGGNTSATPSALDPFPASSVFTGYKAATLNGTSKGPYAYRVTNCVAAYVYCKSGSNKKRTITLAAFEVDGEGNVAASAAESSTYETNSDGVISITLNKDKEYYIKVSQVGSGSGGSSSGNSSFYMIAFQAPYKVTLDPDGGSYPSNTLAGWTYDNVNDKYSKYVAAGSLTLPSAPSKGGYDFTEWQDNKANAYTTSITIDKDTVLTAQWIAAGSAYDVNIASMTNGSVVASPASQVEDGIVTLTVTPDDGYLLSSLSVVGDVSGDEVTVTANQFTMPAEDVTVNATFSLAPTYTVTLNPAGGTIVDATGWTLNAGNYEKEVAEGTVLTLPTFTKTDRAFKTWRKAGPADVASPVTVDGDLSLTAIWTATIEQVIYSWEGAEGGAIETGGTASSSTDGGSTFNDAQINVKQAETELYCLQINGNNSFGTNLVQITLAGEEKVKTGDKIKYWGFYSKSSSANARPKMRDANGSKASIFDDPNNLPNLYSGGEPAERTFTVPASINTNAVQITRSQTGSSTWIPKLQIIREVQVEEGDLLTVTFNTNGGSAIAAVSVEKGTAVAQPADPTKAHCRFEGWQLSGSDYDFSSAVNSNITLDAVWTQLYTISFAAGDGTGDAPAAVPDKAQGETFEVPANTFTAPASKEFDKWNDGSADYAPGATYTVGTANVVLTAQWKAEADKYIVIFKDGETTLDTKLFEVGSNPSDADIDKTKPLFAFAAWQKEGVDIALDDAFWATVVKDASVTLTARWTNVYAQDADLEGLVESEGTGADWQAYMTGKGYAYSTSGVSLDAKAGGKDYNNWPYQGLKAKEIGAYVEGRIAADKLVIIKLGHMAAAANVSLDGVAAGTATGLDADEPAGQLNYFYVENESVLRYETTNGGACVLKAITITNPFQVTFNANGGDPVAPQYGHPAVTLPDASNGTKSLLGWFDAAEGGNKIGDVGESYTPAANIEVFAQWEDVSTDARLASITLDPSTGTLAPAFDPEVTDYTYTMPYGTAAVPQITGATAVNAGGSYSIVSQASAWDETAVIRGVAASSDTKAYNITMKIAPKDGTSIFKAELTSATSATYSGLYADADNSEIKLADDGANGYKFSGTSNYIKMALDGGTFATGDLLTMTYSTNPQQGELAIYENTTKIVGTPFENHTLEFTSGAEGLTELFIRRTSDNNFNGWVSVVEVTRVMDPVLKSITFDGTKINVTGTSVSATLPNGADLTDVTPEIFWNGAGTAVVITNEGAWDWGANTYVLTDKDGDATSYTITLTEDVLKHTVSYYSYDGADLLGTEQVVDGGHPSAAGITAPSRLGFTFQGWAITVDGDVEDLNDIAISADDELYAVYATIPCPTSGTVYKFEIKDGLASENLPIATDMDMSSYIDATGIGLLTYSATANNKATINSDGTIQLKDETNAYLKVELACALAAGDQIRAHVSNNPMRVQVATTFDADDDLILAKNVYNTVDITSAMVGKNVLYIARSTNGNANLADFEIYRRPELTGASLADLTMRQGQSKTPVLTLEPSADAIVTSQVWEIVGTPDNLTGAAIDPATGAITTGTLDDASLNGTISVKVTLNGGSVEATCTATVVDAIVQQDVTKSTVWNWQNTGATANIELNNSTDPKRDEAFVLANVAVNNNADFESDKLVVEGQYMVREYNKTNPYFQGQTIKFKTTKPGAIRVKFSNTGGNPARELYINGVGTGNTSDNGTPDWSDFVEVPAGEVSITAYLADKSEDPAQKYIRVAEIEFLEEIDRRADTPEDIWVKPGELGTVCLKDDAKVLGANVFKVMGCNASGYMVFDEILSGEIEAGKPYLFEVTRNGSVAFFKTVGAAHTETAESDKGMIGTFDGETLHPGTGNYCYFSGRHIWRVNDFSVDITVPAYCCYVDYDEFKNNPIPAAAPAPGHRRVVLGVNGKDEAQGLEDLDASETPMKVMIDGTLYILRGEKVFDATGRLVK